MTKPGAIDLDEMAATLLTAFPKLDVLDQRLSLELYRMLAEGRPVARGDLARRLGIPHETVDRILDVWPGVFSDSDNQIVGYWGLSLASAYSGPHRVTIDAGASLLGAPGTPFSCLNCSGALFWLRRPARTSALRCA